MEPMQPGTAHSNQSDSGSRIRTLFALEPSIIVAADADHEEAMEGAAVDRAAHGMPLSVQFAFPIQAMLASGEEMSVGVAIQDATTTDPDDPTVNTPGTFANYGAQPEAVVIRGHNDGSVVETTARVNVDLGGARRFVRANPTFIIPGSGESVAVAGVCVVGGTEHFPLS